MSATLELFLKRLYAKPSHIIGQWINETDYFCDTMELPWLNNKPMVSCIPAGRYQLKMQWSEHFRRNMPHFQNVPGRTLVMAHDGDFIKDTDGCVLLGTNTAPGILSNSREASDKLNAILTAETRPIWITITNVVA